ncbi:hypothetical protein QE152_g29425 [Popillia japonica]|uniref:Uncharacterized protein n=1 Tax=Popillia japonica TaxID=7064 RepID=A0AAW1JI60_POPJA
MQVFRAEYACVMTPYSTIKLVEARRIDSPTALVVNDRSVSIVESTPPRCVGKILACCTFLIYMCKQVSFLFEFIARIGVPLDQIKSEGRIAHIIDDNVF